MASQDGKDILIVIGIVLLGLVLALVIATSGFLSSEAGADARKSIANFFLRAEARAEEKALEHAGENEAKELLEARLRNNPVVPTEEADEVSKISSEEVERDMGNLRKRL